MSTCIAKATNLEKKTKQPIIWDGVVIAGYCCGCHSACSRSFCPAGFPICSLEQENKM
jgi:hypothetical protein